MRFTPRRRLVVALLVSWPLGVAYVYFVFQCALNLARYARGGYYDCGGNYLDAGLRGCSFGGFTPWQAVLELLLYTAALLTLGIMLTRWVLRPVAEMAGTVAALGPTSLGMRLRVDGPRDETRRLAEAIDAMLDRVAEGYEAQRRFAANASHELRTPLATQRALIEVSLSSAVTTEQLQLLARQLLATNERNEALVEGLLVLAETERGTMTSAPRRLDLVTATVVETLRPTARGRGLQLAVELSPTVVAGELPLLERLVTNLLQNAIKYNHDGGRVLVRVAEPGRLVVANSGAPVAPEQVAGLFEPFRRLSGDRLDHSGGVGLGLTIARSVVAAHRGRIRASANADGGLTVEVVLPAP